MVKYVVKWHDVDSLKRVNTWEISDVPLTNKTEAKDRFLYEIKDQYGLKKKDIKIINIKKRKDTDKDGVPNYRDCEPNNPKKHGLATTFALGAGASYVGSEVSRYVTKRRRMEKLKQSNEEKKYWK